MAGSPWVIDVTEAEFEQKVMERSLEVPVVVDFWAEWCGPCRMLGPILEGLAEERAGAFVLAKVDVDQAQSLAMMLQIQSVPAVFAFKDGRPVDGFMGALPKPEIEQWLDSLGIGPGAAAKPDPGLTEAAALEEKDPAAAKARYEAMLADEEAGEEKHDEAHLGLARLYVGQGEEAQATEHLDRVRDRERTHADAVDELRGRIALRGLARDLSAGDEQALRARVEQSPADADRRYELGVWLCAHDQVAEGLDELIEAARKSKKVARDKVREAMVHGFYVIGSRNPIADGYREELARLLY